MVYSTHTGIIKSICGSFIKFSGIQHQFIIAGNFPADVFNQFHQLLYTVELCGSENNIMDLVFYILFYVAGNLFPCINLFLFDFAPFLTERTEIAIHGTGRIINPDGSPKKCLPSCFQFCNFKSGLAQIMKIITPLINLKQSDYFFPG